ncbi:YhdP family protein [Lysobacter fragariae]
MPTPLRRRFRIARRSFSYAVALVLVLVAVVLGVASQVLPLAERHPDRVAAWLSERAGRPVAFDRLETQWTRRGPVLKLDRLRIGEGAQAFTVGDTEMLVSVYAGLLPGHSFSELRLRGLDLTLERASDGRWQVRGLPGQQQPGSDPFSALEGLGELQVIGAKLAVIAPTLGVDAHLPRVDVRLKVNGDRVRAGVRAWPLTPRKGATVASLDAVLDFDRKKGDGSVYAGAKQADLAAWSPVLRLQGIAIEGGKGRAQAWAQLRGKRVAQVTVDVALDNVAMRGVPLEAGAAPPRNRFARVQALARWQSIKGGWRFDAPRLRIGNDDAAQKLDGLLIAGGDRFVLQAKRIDAAPLLSALALSDKLQPKLRRWLQEAQPSVALGNVEIAGRPGGALHVSGHIANLGFRPVGKSPGLQGLTGDIDGDADGFNLRFDPDASVTFDWPTGFGVPHVVKLRGDVGGWREGAGWRIGTTALRLDGPELGVSARGGLWWQGDGSRPWIDIAAQIDDVQLPVAKGFWIRSDMSPLTIKWLDTALVAGTLSGGRAVVSGDLDDWPFGGERPGYFEATGHINDAIVRFNEEWPPAQGVAADAVFTAQGFDVDGTGHLGDVAITQLHAGIDKYRGGSLTVDAQGHGDAAHLLEVLRHSPLQKEHPETFASLSASGAANVDFRLGMPLHGAATTIDGNVVLKDAKLSDKQWKLAFDQVNGRAVYSRGGFKADDLAVRHEGEPGKLSLRAGSQYVRNAAHVFEAGLDASLGAVALVDRAEDLGWLKPYLGGRSTWTVGIAIPKSAPGKTAPTLLQLSTNLVGTSVDLPAPLRKAASTPLATTIETPLPVGTGDIRVNLGNVMALRARSSNGQTGIRAVLGADHLDEAAPPSGLIATGRADTLDAVDWIALARGGNGDSKLSLQRIDVTAHKLQLLGGTFADTHLIVAPAARGAIAVQAEGAALQGALLVPASESEAIAGRLQRVHWRPVAKATASAAAAAPVAGAAPAAGADRGDDIDPAKIPALTFDIDDLQVGDAMLGAAKVRTHPTASGMRFEQFQSRAAKQRIDMSGDWNGRAAASTTRLDLKVDSDDFGSLLSGFGLAGRIGGGQGTAHFTAGWPGTPVGFRLDGLDGALVLDVRDGRLLEIEPGAGRVLGLLSLAQLPRRLTLDFSDFFSKGFAFNKLGGSVRFGGGQARSEGLVIDGPAATIDISGAANLRAQSFDQTIEVRPKAGNLLTAIGAVAGGPVGAAIGAAANAMLKKPLGALAAKTYRVTGPWKEPKVEVMTREQSRAPASPTQPPPG